MTFIDSKAAFEQRCKELAAPADLFELLTAQGITTFSALSYAIGTPNKPPTDASYDQLGAKVFGVPTLGQSSMLRRIHFEACTFVMQHLKSQVAGDTSDGVRRLPFAEKQARFQDVKQKLAGFVIEGETEPSFALIDKCQAMYDSGSVTWIQPSLCTKREMEIQAAPKDTTQVFRIEAQTLKVDTEAQKIGEADHGSEIKLQWCMQRRGIALEMCNLVSWAVSQTWLATMFNNYATDPPSGYGRITLQQLIRADKELWTLAARQTTSIRPDAKGDRPLDALLKTLMNDPRVTMHMLALPQRASASSHADTPKRTGPPSTTRPNPKKKQRPGKRQRTAPTPPEELKDCHQSTTDGRPICRSYNLASGCNNSAHGTPPACNRGCHVCAYCRKPGHSFQKCKAAPMNKGSS